MNKTPLSVYISKRKESDFTDTYLVNGTANLVASEDPITDNEIISFSAYYIKNGIFYSSGKRINLEYNKLWDDGNITAYAYISNGKRYIRFISDIVDRIKIYDMYFEYSPFEIKTDEAVSRRFPIGNPPYYHRMIFNWSDKQQYISNSSNTAYSDDCLIEKINGRVLSVKTDFNPKDSNNSTHYILTNPINNSTIDVGQANNVTFQKSMYDAPLGSAKTVLNIGNVTTTTGEVSFFLVTDTDTISLYYNMYRSGVPAGTVLTLKNFYDDVSVIEQINFHIIYV